jgi:adenosylcobinamide-phosphate synthase
VRRSATALGLVLGVALDGLLGDPRHAHPVAAYGRYAAALDRRLHRDDHARGALYAAAALLPLVAAAGRLEEMTSGRPVRHVALVAAATWTVLGGHSLRRVAADIGATVEAGDLAAARRLLPSLCGRDPHDLDAAGIARATVESVAENTCDAVVAPLFWGAVAGLPGLLGYRAVNTLDAMVGHRSARYARFGTAAAWLDDAANLLPARLTGALTLLAAPLLGGDARAGLAAWRTGAHRHPSPNSGVCESAAAGVLGVRLGGRTVYAGRVEERPWLGAGADPGGETVRQAVRLSRAVQFGALAALALVAGAWR